MRSPPPVIRISNATFYRTHPRAAAATGHLNPPLLSNLTFSLPSTTPQNWCVVGPSLSGKTTFLHALQGRLLCDPPTARTYPYLATEHVPFRLRTPAQAIRYVGFDDAGSGVSESPATAAYLSARYESRRELTDFSLRDFLLGNTELNPLVKENPASLREMLARVAADLNLAELLELPASFLSNGQGRRARIARALLLQPQVLLLDEPFVGLDPATVAALSPLLAALAEKASPRLVLAARPQDQVPSWITHLVYLTTECTVGEAGTKEEVLDKLRHYARAVRQGTRQEDRGVPVDRMAKLIDGDGAEHYKGTASSPRGSPQEESTTPSTSDTQAKPVVEMDGCRVKYGSKVVVGNWTQPSADGTTKPGLVWTVRQGERWGLFGPNGSGKTTVVSLLCSDHPQTYSLPIRLFGQSRLPEPGSGQRALSYWDIQARIGHSSPEVHRHMPRSLTVRQVVQNAWADTFLTWPQMDADARAKVDAALAHFAAELLPSASSDNSSSSSSSSSSSAPDTAWADTHRFGELSFSAQRVALFLRAVIKGAEIVVLDEAFSGMDDRVRDKCMGFLDSGVPVPGRAHVAAGGLAAHQALICISHVRDEVPDCVSQWVCLPEANSGEAARFGVLDGSMREDGGRGWQQVWDQQEV